MYIVREVFIMSRDDTFDYALEFFVYSIAHLWVVVEDCETDPVNDS